MGEDVRGLGNVEGVVAEGSIAEGDEVGGKVESGIVFCASAGVFEGTNAVDEPQPTNSVIVKVIIVATAVSNRIITLLEHGASYLPYPIFVFILDLSYQAVNQSTVISSLPCGLLEPLIFGLPW